MRTTRHAGEYASVNAPEPFEALAQRMRPRLLSIARRALADAADAEDLVQEILLGFWRLMGSGAKVVSPEAWLVSATKRRAISRNRSAHAHPSGAEEPDSPSPATSPHSGDRGSDPARNAPGL